MQAGNVANYLTLQDPRHRVVISPNEGAGLVLYDAIKEGKNIPVLRSRSTENSGVFGLAMNVLAPFSNRLSSGGFEHDGVFHAVLPNLADEAYPIHGDAFQKPWQVIRANNITAHLCLCDGHIGPYNYQADIYYEIDKNGLNVQLIITNQGETLPFGGGFHPWFPRDNTTRLQFIARNVWLEDSSYLPTQQVSLADAGLGVFDKPSSLPENWINNAFTGWDGTAMIHQRNLGIDLMLKANSPLDVAVIYSPNGNSQFFCFEPVSHSVDCHNLPGKPGLKVLMEGEQLIFAMTLGWSAGPIS